MRTVQSFPIGLSHPGKPHREIIVVAHNGEFSHGHSISKVGDRIYVAQECYRNSDRIREEILKYSSRGNWERTTQLRLGKVGL